jgi:hypothetical protein
MAGGSFLLKIGRLMNANRPFPIQGGVKGRQRFAPSTIPWWLAEIAYKHYKSRWPGQTLERIAERGGFGRAELVKLLRRE